MWIAAQFERAGKAKSKRGLAKAMDVAESAISRILSGERQVKAEELEVARHYFEALKEEIENQQEAPGETGMPIMGEVRAGAWLEIEDAQEPLGYLPIIKDKTFGDRKQFALRVVGNSMDKFAAPGTYVLVVEWHNPGVDGVEDGKVYVVQRQRAMTYEVTLKKARWQDNTWQLWPESTDPRYQEPIQLHDGDRDVQVEIIGKVIGKYESTY